MARRTNREPGRILTLNGGSSSIRFAIYRGEDSLLKGKLDRIGGTGTILEAQDHAGNQSTQRFRGVKHSNAGDAVLDWLTARPEFQGIGAAGHRVVHGMKHSQPERVTPKLLAELRRIGPYDPDHLPAEIKLIETLRDRLPKLPQVACFDTAFHRTMPRVAKLVAIPHKYQRQGIERYGFHGLSYAFLMEEMERLDPRAAKGRMILAHLGSGASMAAVNRGKSVDTSMGFTPSSGLVMGTRAGDIDSGLPYFLARTEGMSAAAFQSMVNHQSGLLGVSGISSDVRTLTDRARTNPRAAEALDLFCYQARKFIGAFAAALGGVDTLVFSAGVGENSPHIRERICRDLGFLGIRLSAPRNASNAPLISTEASPVKVRVIPTDEERMIARSVAQILRKET